VTEARWDRLDLARRLCHALDIALKSLERLAASGYQDPVEPANNLPAEKIIAETAVLLIAASTIRDSDALSTRFDRVARALIPHARSDRMRLGLCMRPALAWDYGLAHLCLRRLGYPDAQFERLLRRSLRSQACAGRERPPHRVLEIEWMSRMKRGLRAATPQGCSATARQSVLNHPIDIYGGTRDDVYAFTHAVMYVADFNIHPQSFPRPPAVLLAEAEAALARALDEEDYDIGGELILAWPLTGTTWSAAAAFGFHVLADVEDQVGFLPAAATQLHRLNALQGEARGEYLSATAYHTAYVMGLLCAAALGDDHAPPRRLPTRDGATGSAAAVTEFLNDGSRRRHWQDLFDRLSPDQRDAASGMLLMIGLHRRIAAHDFEAVAALLGIAVTLGIADTPAASQAAELLDRLSLFLRPAL
jgi:hypothetical protein